MKPKKLFALFLTLLLALSCTTPALAAQSTVTIFDVYDLNLPTEGMTVKTSLADVYALDQNGNQLPLNSKDCYCVERGNLIFMEETDTFKAGKTYLFSISLDKDAVGYVCDSDGNASITPYRNGQPWSEAGVYGGGPSNTCPTINWRYTVPANVQTPVLTAGPSDAYLSVGTTAIFTAKASGTDLSYQWYFFEKDTGFVALNDDSIYEGCLQFTGANTSTLTLKLLKDPYFMFGEVYCVISNSGGSVKTDTVHYYVSEDTASANVQAPVLTAEPSDAYLSVGTTASFTAKASGTDLSYQWYFFEKDAEFVALKDDSIYESCLKFTGSNTSTLTLELLKNPYFMFGEVYCVISNSGGSVKTDTVHYYVSEDTASDTPFTDLPQNAWYRDSVQKATEMGLINGKSKTSYCPDDNMTYAEAIKLAACMNQLYNEGKVTLTNGTPNWYSTYVAYCLEKKIIDQDYSAVINQKIDRQTYAAIFAKALPAEALSAKNTIPDNSIPDVKKGNAFYDGIYTLYRAGIINGSKSDGTFNPTRNIKRSEVATILVRMMDETCRVDAPADFD